MCVAARKETNNNKANVTSHPNSGRRGKVPSRNCGGRNGRSVRDIGGKLRAKTPPGLCSENSRWTRTPSGYRRTNEWDDTHGYVGDQTSRCDSQAFRTCEESLGESIIHHNYRR